MNKRSNFSNSEYPAGFVMIGAHGFSNGLLFVPQRAEKELAECLKEIRSRDEMAQKDQVDGILNTIVTASREEVASDPATSHGADSSLSTPVADVTVPSEQGFELVACVSEADVMAQKAATEVNTKFSDRDRNNAMKAVIKKLTSRPLTRRIGRPRDVEESMKKLALIAPHMPELVQTLRIPLLVAASTGAPPMIPPILLVGGAGVGKSHAALMIAEILGVPSHTVSYAASGAVGSVLSGSDKNWGNSSTGAIFNALSDGEFANPVICLDEIDKASISTTVSGQERNPLNELLALLEPLTAKEHMDRCAEIRVDARHIVWVATANSLQGLSAPLLSRFKLILVNKPDARAAVTIALSVTQAVSTQMGVSVKPPSGEVLQLLATLTPRVMRRIWTLAAGWAAANKRERVTMNDIEHSLGHGSGLVSRLH
ncbi:MAG: AAA family ATPase [Rhodoferax sp.]|uniref:AAA family ATPase n=1 Tax=Rhodoferax sp. TaxID=50421 RepID=UPI00261AF7D5|nr:AAA family ATPase [Rhodoferax sp.]MDD2881443.1 AAA family ATPase [Rhodoferax sp.]